MDDVDYIMKKEAIALGADAIVDMYYENAFKINGANGIAVRYKD